MSSSFSLSGVTLGLHLTTNTIDGFSSQAVGTFSAVPEPSSVITVAIGALGMAGYGLRRRKVRAD